PPSVPTQSLKQPDTVQPSHDQNRPPSDHGAIENVEQDRPRLEHAISPQQNSISWPSNNGPAISNAISMPSSTAAGAEHGRSQETKESVADAVSGLAQQVDREATEALTRVEQEQIRIEPSHDSENTAITEHHEEYPKPSQPIYPAAEGKSPKEERSLKEDTAL